MSKIFPELFKDQMRGCVVFLIALVVVLVPVACLCLGLSLLSSAGVDSDTTSFLAIIGIICLASLFVIGLPLLMFIVLRLRSGKLDAAFAPLGLTGSMYMLTGRRYHGTVQGRGVDVLFYRGPTLTIYLDTPLKTRFNVGERDRAGAAIAGLFNRHPLALDDPAMSGLVVYALDEAWTRTVLSQPDVPEILQRLITAESPFVFQQVHLQPEAFVLRFHRMRKFLAFGVDIQPEQVRQWLGDLIALAEIAERQPPPQETAEATGLERRLRGR